VFARTGRLRARAELAGTTAVSLLESTFDLATPLRDRLALIGVAGREDRHI
jgi:hypothetical protein